MLRKLRKRRRAGWELGKAGPFFWTTRVRIRYAAWQRLFSRHVVASAYPPWLNYGLLSRL
jgi:hypothetical protein